MTELLTKLPNRGFVDHLLPEDRGDDRHVSIARAELLQHEQTSGEAGQSGQHPRHGQGREVHTSRCPAEKCAFSCPTRSFSTSSRSRPPWKYLTRSTSSC